MCQFFLFFFTFNNLVVKITKFIFIWCRCAAPAVDATPATENVVISSSKASLIFQFWFLCFYCYFHFYFNFFSFFSSSLNWLTLSRQLLLLLHWKSENPDNMCCWYCGYCCVYFLKFTCSLALVALTRGTSLPPPQQQQQQQQTVSCQLFGILLLFMWALLISLIQKVVEFYLRVRCSAQ